MNLAIAHHSPAALAERCDVAGVRTAYGEADYEDGAVLPDGPWQPLTADLAHQLRPTALTWIAEGPNGRRTGQSATTIRLTSRAEVGQGGGSVSGFREWRGGSGWGSGGSNA